MAEKMFRGIMLSRLSILCRSLDLVPLRNGLRSLMDKEMLTSSLSQSRLSPEQLAQLQKDTKFDKKELQQWYKGLSHIFRSYLLRAADRCYLKRQDFSKTVQVASLRKRNSKKSTNNSFPLATPHPSQIMSLMFSTRINRDLSTSRNSSAP